MVLSLGSSVHFSILDERNICFSTEQEKEFAREAKEELEGGS